MPQITRRQFEVVSAALLARKSIVDLNKSWQWVHKHLGIGKVVGKSLHLSTDDLNALKQTIEAASGANPMATGIDYASRTDAAKDVIDEKWASTSIGGRGVYLARIGDTLMTRNGACHLAPGVAAWVSYSEVVLSPRDIIVVIENLEAFLRWGEFIVPAELRSAIALYRGHDANTRGTYDWLRELSGRQAIIAFTDFDPAGLRIALDIPGVAGWLVPANPGGAGPSNHALFSKQSTYLMGLQRETPSSWRSGLQAMLDDHLAITQERMCANRIPLIVLPR